MESTVFDIPRRKTATRLFLSTDVRNDPEQTNNKSTVVYVARNRNCVLPLRFAFKFNRSRILLPSQILLVQKQ